MLTAGGQRPAPVGRRGRGASSEVSAVTGDSLGYPHLDVRPGHVRGHSGSPAPRPALAPDRPLENTTMQTTPCPRSRRRRRALALGALGSPAAAARPARPTPPARGGVATGAAGSAAYPVTVATKFGDVTVKAQPTKIVALGLGRRRDRARPRLPARRRLRLARLRRGRGRRRPVGRGALHDHARRSSRPSSPRTRPSARCKPDLILDTKGSGRQGPLRPPLADRHDDRRPRGRRQLPDHRDPADADDLEGPRRAGEGRRAAQGASTRRVRRGGRRPPRVEGQDRRRRHPHERDLGCLRRGRATG